jgi:predicted RNA-binding Zn-ribbon protein involved in translation (DUF1610 family)
MYCTCCGDVIAPEEVNGEEICPDCMSIIDSSENVFLDEDVETTVEDV